MIPKIRQTVLGPLVLCKVWSLRTKLRAHPVSCRTTLRLTRTQIQCVTRLALALISALTLFGQAPTTVVFDLPGSMGTYAESINNAGVVTGWYSDQTDTNRYSFIRHRNGTLTTFGVPGSTTTQASAINDAGYVAGIFIDPASGWRGFIRDPLGHFDLFDLPNQTLTTSVEPLASIPIGPQVIAQMNNRGTVAGYWYHGFLRNLNGQVTVFDGPSLDSLSSVSGLNNLDHVVGQYRGHGYIRTLDGVITVFDPPDSTSTDARRINNHGTIVGDFLQANQYRGFIRDKQGKYVLVDAPGAQNTMIWDINEGGDAAGFIFDAGYQNVRGFIRDKNGSYAMIDGMNALYAGHFVLGRCSLNEVGDIVGTHLDANGLHGFIRFRRGIPTR